MEAEKRYKGVRRRRWGKWVSEIRVPSSRERLWLGSYSTPEAAAVAHDTAVFLLRGPSSAGSFNFPEQVSLINWTGQIISPRSVQRVASDSGMAVDAQITAQFPVSGFLPVTSPREVGFDKGDDVPLDISVDDMEIWH